MKLKNTQLIANLCNDIKSDETYREYIRLKDQIELNETNSFLINKYHELQMKLIIKNSSECEHDENESEFKKILNMIQADDILIQYLLAEYKMNSYITDLFHALTKELDLPFLNNTNISDVV